MFGKCALIVGVCRIIRIPGRKAHVHTSLHASPIPVLHSHFFPIIPYSYLQFPRYLFNPIVVGMVFGALRRNEHKDL
jgi:hypothetical protein